MNVFWSITATVITLGVLTTDFVLFLRRGRDSTLSATVRRANAAWPLTGVTLGFLTGALFGHFFW